MPKTIFNTTEKSNFILNMKTSEYHRFNLKVLLGFLLLMPLFCIPLEFAKVYSVPGMALSITGVLAIVFVFIGFMKKVTPASMLLPAVLLGGMVIWSCVSLYNSYFYNISLFGADGRSEGVLSVVFYGCFFLLGAQLGTDDNRLKLLNGMLLLGLVECVWGLLQALPIGMISYYKNLEPMLLFRVFLPSGLTGSPVFLATLLVMLCFPAMLGAVLAKDKKSRSFYTVCAAVYALVSVKTQCSIGVFGMAAAILIAFFVILIKKGGRLTFLKTGIVLAAFLIGVGWMYLSPSINGTYSRSNGTETEVSDALALYDGGIIWEDSSYRLAVSGYYVNGSNNPNGDFDISSLTDSYSYLWKSTAKIIKLYPLVGSGPDSLVYPQLYQNLAVVSNPNVFDQCYNYYLYLAGTMGIPMLLLFAALMVLVLVRGAAQCRKGNWLSAGLYGAVVLYLLMMFIGTSAITVAPLFWMLAGILAGESIEKKQ
jgi:hypothetical protein